MFSLKIAPSLNIFLAFRNIFYFCLVGCALMKAGVAVWGLLLCINLAIEFKDPRAFAVLRSSASFVNLISLFLVTEWSTAMPRV